MSTAPPPTYEEAMSEHPPSSDDDGGSDDDDDDAKHPSASTKSNDGGETKLMMAPSGGGDGGGAMYEDGYCVAGARALSVKSYYFPGKGKHIQYHRISSFNTAKDLNLSGLAYKNWGMGLSNIWWAVGARQFGHEAENQIVLEVKGSKVRVGFTCSNPAKLLPLLVDLAPSASHLCFTTPTGKDS
ncbi:hypothetical protein Pelo_17042 [Pelomyxa schiedti]|nr:hypothetical protein Pelo_17042 [Pelomyxa schiedti]